MKKNLNSSTLIAWLLVATFSINTPASVYAQKQTNTKEEKVNILKRLVNNFKETRALYRKKKAGKASPQELKILETRMKKIKRAAVASGVILAFIAATAAGVYLGKKRTTKEADKPLENNKEANEHLKTDADELIKDLSLVGIIKQKYDNVANFQKLDFSKIISQKRAQIDGQDTLTGKTALYLAAEHDDLEMVKKLLKNGANPNILDANGKTILFYVFTTIPEPNKTEYIKILVEKGADPNTTNNFGGSLLLSAVNNNNEKLVKLLLAKGAELWTQSGKSILEIAVNKGNEDIVKDLLDNGANPSIIINPQQISNRNIRTLILDAQARAKSDAEIIRLGL